MTVLLLTSGNLNPATGTLTPRFTGATGFYIDAPGVSEEIEIDVFLQVYIPTQAGETPRNLPLGRLREGEIKLNETDTESILPIPNEFLESQLEMALFFLSSEVIELEVWLVYPDCSLCSIESQISTLSDSVDNRFNQIEQKIDDGLLELENLINQQSGSQSQTNQLLQAAINLVLNYLGIPVPILPPSPVSMSSSNHSNYFNSGFI